jgi:hypothetical protein
MSISIDYGANGVNVFTDTVGRWDDDPATRIDEVQRQEILRDISVALEKKGLTGRFIPTG